MEGNLCIGMGSSTDPVYELKPEGKLEVWVTMQRAVGVGVGAEDDTHPVDPLEPEVGLWVWVWLQGWYSPC